ncbi:MAG: hypothetical protein AAFP76_16685 [Bacteroidota bacterium]
MASRKRLLYVVFLIVPILGFSQYSERYKELTSGIQPIDSLPIDETYRNGRKKAEGLIYVYRIGDDYFEVPVGVVKEYNRGGTLDNITEFDAFGNTLQYTSYGECGICFDAETLELQTNAQNISDFLADARYVTTTYYVKQYEYTDIPCSKYLEREGKQVDMKKVGPWKLYNPDGSLKKEKNFD